MLASGSIIQDSGVILRIDMGAPRDYFVAPCSRPLFRIHVLCPGVENSSKKALLHTLGPNIVTIYILEAQGYGLTRKVGGSSYGWKSQQCR